MESVGSRVVYKLDYKKPILYGIPIQSILGKLHAVPVGDTGTIPHHLRNTFPQPIFLALPATADRVLAMDAGCGSSTRGLLDGPRTCNDSIRVAAREAAWRKVPCEKLRGEKLNVDTLHRHVWAVLSSNLAVL